MTLKNEGNKAFAAHDWPKAVDFYTQAIELNDKEPTFFTNRAQVRLTPFLCSGTRGTRCPPRALVLSCSPCSRDWSFQLTSTTLGPYQVRSLRLRHL